MRVTDIIRPIAWIGILLGLLLPRVFGITHPSLDYVFLACGLTLFVSMVITWRKM